MAEDLDPRAVKYYADALGVVPSRLEAVFRAIAERIYGIDDSNFAHEMTRLADHPCVVIFCPNHGGPEAYIGSAMMTGDMKRFLDGDNIPMPNFVALGMPDMKTAVAFEAALKHRTGRVQ